MFDYKDCGYSQVKRYVSPYYDYTDVLCNNPDYKYCGDICGYPDDCPIQQQHEAWKNEQ